MGRLEGGEGVAWVYVIGFYFVSVLEGAPADGAVGGGGHDAFALLPVVRAVHGLLVGLAFWGVACGVFALL